eukprot:TRINITY_DN57471_c0_g1_i1.p1 TRINITY_DN57471_c0_g1~~TRINITY_DN57471_c0_g1_i1.p1  ORF type:complete len:164 (+),score=13.93 TRINITY_DN57471_c0_g1_i1:38-493(+)
MGVGLSYYYKYYGGEAPKHGDQCCVHLGDISSGYKVTLHCEHTICLECFERYIEHDHVSCPLCRTPLVVMAPNPVFFQSWASYDMSDTKQYARWDRLNQYRMLHDGDNSSPLLPKLHGGVPDDFIEQVRSSCRCCPYSRRASGSGLLVQGR